jgi:hypothetical protein
LATVEKRLSIRLCDLKSGRILTIQMDHKPEESGKMAKIHFLKISPEGRNSGG